MTRATERRGRAGSVLPTKTCPTDPRRDADHHIPPSRCGVKLRMRFSICGETLPRAIESDISHLTLAQCHCRGVRVRLYRRFGKSGDQSDVFATKRPGCGPERGLGTRSGRPSAEQWTDRHPKVARRGLVSSTSSPSCRSCPRRRPSESPYPLQDRSVQFTRDRHLCQLECHVPGMMYDLRADLDQPIP